LRLLLRPGCQHRQKHDSETEKLDSHATPPTLAE
jgi:hypothetical protein